MKDAIHPTYHSKAKIRCACGAEFVIGSTAEKIDVELCSNCHPFYTGKQKIVDTARRVEKFQERAAKKTTAAKTRKGRKTKKVKRAAQKAEKKPKMEKEEA